MTHKQLFDEIVDNGKKETFEKYGWTEYYGSWIKKEWIEKSEPYDRMAMDEGSVMNDIIENTIVRVGKHIHHIS